MSRIELGDSIQLIKSVDTESVHLILSDIPYGINYDKWDVLHNNTNSALLGKSPAQEKCGSIFKDMIAWEKDSAAYRAQRVSCVFDRRNDEQNSLAWEGWKIGNTYILSNKRGTNGFRSILRMRNNVGGGKKSK